jgi:DMSO/TMAO reductase YedYZ heme-binding membrane subunit
MLRRLTGPVLLLTIQLVILALVAVCLCFSADLQEALRSSIRLTARSSLLLFLSAFVSAALCRLWPTPFVAWLRSQRRYLGLGFAGSHAIHAALFLSLASLTPTLRVEVLSTQMLIFGGMGYFFILLMATTSSDRMQRRLGMPLWRLLHAVGAYYIWFQFMVSFGKRLGQHPLYWLPLALLGAAMVIRLIARIGGLKRRAVTAGAA